MLEVGGWTIWRTVTTRVVVVVPLVLATAVVLSGWFTHWLVIETHFANADDLGLVKHGKHIYLEQCASCHGRYLQGQPLWQLIGPTLGRRAPAHDQTGHTWDHSDEDLFRMTQYGVVADTPTGRPSAMPAFGEVLSDNDAVAVIAFIKASWPIGLRVLQALHNPGRMGMPAAAANAGWTLPPNCSPAAQRAADGVTRRD